MDIAQRAVREIEPRLQPFKGVPEKLARIDESTEHLRQSVLTNQRRFR